MSTFYSNICAHLYNTPQQIPIKPIGYLCRFFYIYYVAYVPRLTHVSACRKSIYHQQLWACCSFQYIPSVGEATGWGWLPACCFAQSKHHQSSEIEPMLLSNYPRSWGALRSNMKSKPSSGVGLSPLSLACPSTEITRWLSYLHDLLFLWVPKLLPLLSSLRASPALPTFAFTPHQFSAELMIALLLGVFRLPNLISLSHMKLCGPQAFVIHRLINFPFTNTRSKEQQPYLSFPHQGYGWVPNYWLPGDFSRDNIIDFLFHIQLKLVHICKKWKTERYRLKIMFKVNA